ncbi:S9 family peptidase [Nibricoccus aquaticus]|nr:prolyl oligopeptidase family serine peptidase [Nibricoccus aquaticus]
MRIASICLLLCAAFLTVAHWQVAHAESPKHPLSHQDFDSWRSISTTPVLSRDGRWLAYAFMPLEGDGDLIIRNLTTGQEQRVPIGALPPQPLTASEENPDRASPRREATITFTSDSHFVICTRFPAQEETLRAKREKKPAAEMPREGLVVIALDNGNVSQLASVKNFQVPARGGAWLAYRKEPAANASPPVTKPEKTGTDLVLMDLTAPASSAERTFTDVLDYWFSRDAHTLVFSVSSTSETRNGLFAVTPGDSTEPFALASGPGKYLQFTWDREQTQAVFATDRDAQGSMPAQFSLYHWLRKPNTEATPLITPKTTGLPSSLGINSEAAPIFSQDGKRLSIPAARIQPVPDKRRETLIDEEKVTADLWHWRDDFVPTLQRQRADKERKRAYWGVLDLASRRYVQLADLTLPSVTIADSGTHAFGLDDRPYRRRFDYDGIFQDLHLTDATNGERRLLVKELGEKSGVRWSHNSRWIAFYHEKHWHSIDAQTGAIKNLTQALPAFFADELVDYPGEIPSYGTAGWTRDGDSLLVYDRYDMWQLFADGSPARCLTSGFGRENKIILRLQNIEQVDAGDDKRGINTALPLLLRGEDEITRATGFFRTSFDSTEKPARLLWQDKNLRYLNRAADADVLLFSASRFDEFPDLYTSNAQLDRFEKVSNGGAQLGPFLWGNAEMLSYRNADGIELPAVLYKPANFDPSKKYPMIVYLYERLSQVIHTFNPPVPSAVINLSHYTSNGYLVLTPDIRYTLGQPGQSAVKCVLPAVDEIVRRGFVNENAIGIQGHSWGGYQTAYLLTQTHRFRAAEAGAVVANMTSAYSGIRQGSGRVRQFQYEHYQSRIGKPLHEAPHLYVENSPVFHAERIETPLLLLHNDQDDAVPFAQGLELFLTLRRLGKECYLLNYNNEFHGLRRRADQRDFALRMNQFFDHFLKDSPKPDWMENGIPFSDREEEKLRFRDAAVSSPASAQP